MPKACMEFTARHRERGEVDAELQPTPPRTLTAGPYRGRQPSRSQAGQASLHIISHTDEMYQPQRGISLT